MRSMWPFITFRSCGDYTVCTMLTWNSTSQRACGFTPWKGLVLSMLIKIVMIIALGASAISVVVFEVLLNATSMFNHGNVRLPRGLDRILRCLLVTPEMHRVHHSIIRSETDSNFGFNFPWWIDCLAPIALLPLAMNG